MNNLSKLTPEQLERLAKSMECEAEQYEEWSDECAGSEYGYGELARQAREKAQELMGEIEKRNG